MLSPGTLDQYMEWLDNNTAHASSFGRVYEIPFLYGFVFGFRKDFQPFEHSSNILIREAAVNSMQERSLITIGRNTPYACSDVFVYHTRAATITDKFDKKLWKLHGGEDPDAAHRADPAAA